MMIVTQAVQSTLEDLSEGLGDRWKPKGGNNYTAYYDNGPAVIHGPLVVGNPNAPFFEVQVLNQETLDEVAARSVTCRPLKDEARMNGLLRANARVNKRALILNNNKKPIGYIPANIIYGTNAEMQFLGEEDNKSRDQIEELLDLEDLED